MTDKTTPHIAMEFDASDIQDGDLLMQFRQDGSFKVKAVKGKDEKGLMKLCLTIGWFLSDEDKAVMLRTLAEAATLEHALRIIEQHRDASKDEEERERLDKKAGKVTEELKEIAEIMGEMRSGVEQRDGAGDELSPEEEAKIKEAVGTLVENLEEKEREADESEDHKAALEGCATPRNMH